MRSHSSLLVMLLAGAVVLATCGDVPDVAGPPPDFADAAAALVPAPQEICGLATEVTLSADGNVPVGVVRIANDASHLYVTYRTDDAWPIAKTALFVGGSATEIPTSGGGNPSIGRFPYSARHPGGNHEVTWKVALSEAGGPSAVIAAFAEVGQEREGAWSAGEPINPSAGWATYSIHAVQECASATIGTGGGTVMTNLGNVILEVEAGALDEDVEITIEPAGSTNPQVLEGTVFDFGPDGLEFATNALLTIAYDEAMLPADMEEDRIRPVLAINGVFEILGSYEQDADENTVTFPVEHFSLYGLAYVEFADIAVENLVAAPNPARVTEAISLTVDVGNTGLTNTSVDAVDVAVTFLDPLFIVDGASPGCATTGEIVPDGVRFSCTVGPLGPGQSAEIRYDLRPQVAAANQTGTIRVEAAPAATSGVEDPAPDNHLVETQVDILPESFADLRITGVGSTPPNSVKAGLPVELHANAESKMVSGAEPVDATISWTFPTGAPSLDILHGDLPAGCSGTSTPNTTSISCDVGTLAPGGAVSRTVSVRPRTDGVFNATITIHPTTEDPTPADNSVGLSFVAQLLEVDLAVASFDASLDELAVDETLIYSALVENLTAALDAPVEAVLRIEVVGEAAFDNVSAGCTDVSDAVGGASVAVNCPLPQLAPGAVSEQFNLVLHPTAAGQTLQATARLLLPGWHHDQNEANNSAMLETRVRADNEVDFELRNFAGSANSVKAFADLTYSADVVLVSTSAGSTTGGEYRLEIVGDVEVTATSAAGCTVGPLLLFDGIRVSCPLGTYASTGSKTFTVTVRATEAPQTLQVDATIMPPADVTEIDPGDESASAQTDVTVLEGDLFLTTISDTPDPVPAGEIVRYGVYGMSGGTGDDMPRVIVQFRVDGDAELVSMPTGVGVSCTDLSAGNLLAVVVNCDIEPLRAGIASPQLLLDVRALSGPALAAEAEIFAISAYAVDTDPSNNQQTESTAVGPPPSTAVVYVASAGSDQVHAVDPNTGAVIAAIPVGDGPRGLRVTPDGSEVWVLNRISQNISIISTSTNTVTTTVNRTVSTNGVVGDLFDIDFTPDGSRAYITVNESGASARVLVMDVASRTQVTNISMPLSFPGQIRVLPGGSKAYVGSSGGVAVLDLAANTVHTTIAATGSVRGLTVAGDGSAVWFTNEPDNLTGVLRRIDPVADALVGTGIAVGIDPRGVALNSAGTHAYVAEQRNRLFFVDLAAGTASDISTGLGTAPVGIAITPDDLWLFVGFLDAGQLGKVDIASASLAGTTTVGSFPGGVVIRP
jgi:YVTN family beta-propeller protein